MLRFFYTLLLLVATPLMLLRLWLRGRREPGYRQHIGERFGDFTQEKLRDSIWIHAVSVGETRAAALLVAALRTQYPQQPMLITCMTVTGRATATELYGSFASIAYLPYDFPWASRQLIERFDPCVLLIMETEIWPNLIASCRDARIPALLVNARLSERSRAGYARWAIVRTLIREALQGLQQVAAQSSEDAQRLTSLGANNVVITGNMKFDIEPSHEQIALGTAWRNALNKRHESRHVLLTASTREGEETLLIDAYKTHFDDAARARTILVIVPRHPQRFDDVHAQIVSAGLRIQRRSESTEISHDTDVWLGDSMGEMFAYLQMCDVAFIGGSLVPVGGQNLIEACALGKPVLMGPSDFNFADAAKQAEATGAMIRVIDANQFATTARALLDDDQQRAAMSQRALAFAASHRGATDKTVALITHLLK
jgi:3-deoxy-D-manno-octulosonic-acid transferase